jgi:hypothetical protein
MADQHQVASIQVGISIYRQRFDHIRRCLDSCLNQHSVPVQVVVRLDGPDAVEPEVLDWLQELTLNHHDFYLLKGVDRLGAFGSYRQIFAVSDSEFLCQVDADDFLPPYALSITHSFLTAHPDASFLYTQCLDVDVNDTPIALGHRAMTPFSYDAHLTTFMTYHLRLVRRHFYDAVGGYCADFNYTGDYDLSLRLAEVGDVVFLDQPLYFYRLHHDSASQQKRKEVNDEVLMVCRRALQRRGLEDSFDVSCDAEGRLLLHARTGESVHRHLQPLAEQEPDSGIDYEYVNERIFYISPVEAHS